MKCLAFIHMDHIHCWFGLGRYFCVWLCRLSSWLEINSVEPCLLLWWFWIHDLCVALVSSVLHNLKQCEWVDTSWVFGVRQSGLQSWCYQWFTVNIIESFWISVSSSREMMLILPTSRVIVRNKWHKRSSVLEQCIDMWRT